MFRTLRADEIELRVGTCTENGFSLLLYKDARCDMNILDEEVGMMHWKREHSRDNANCTVSIYDSDIGEWVSKEDTGTESFTEKEKGLASDSFKRACVNWGIGRELYTAPFIWIKGHVKKGTNGKYKPADNYDRDLHVSSIAYDDKRNITSLVIKDKNNVSVFSFKQGKTSADKSISVDTKPAVNEQEMPSPTSDSVTEKDRPQLVSRVSELISEKKLNVEDVYKKLGVDNLSQIDTSRLPGMIQWLESMREGGK